MKTTLSKIIALVLLAFAFSTQAYAYDTVAS